jgi:hypothetical protein
MQIFDGFWKWYNKHLLLNTGIAAFLFALQLVHLYWLTTHVVFLKAFGFSIFNPSDFYQTIIILVDYTEIPALITTSLVYINDIRRNKKSNFKNYLYLLFLNIQLVHIFWITDEFVVDTLSGISNGTILPEWAAWIAIFIDYLELPVIFETMKKLYDGLKDKNLAEINKALKED